MVFVKSLFPNAEKKIIQPSLKIKQEVKPMRLSKKQSDNLIHILKKIPEPRLPQGIRHKMISIIAITICALICNAQTFAAIAEWAKSASPNILKRLRCRRDKNTQKYIPRKRIYYPQIVTKSRCPKRRPCHKRILPNFTTQQHLTGCSRWENHQRSKTSRWT